MDATLKGLADKNNATHIVKGFEEHVGPNLNHYRTWHQRLAMSEAQAQRFAEDWKARGYISVSIFEIPVVKG